jgi:hypothetical protein
MAKTTADGEQFPCRHDCLRSLCQTSTSDDRKVKTFPDKVQRSCQTGQYVSNDRKCWRDQQIPAWSPVDSASVRSVIAQFQGRSAQKRGTIVTAGLMVWESQ